MMHEPRDYSVEAETPAGALRNALALLDATVESLEATPPAVGRLGKIEVALDQFATLLQSLPPMRARLVQALTLLERP